MILRLKKYENKKATLSCIRRDGSICWTHLYSGMEDHELAHYAVESCLNFKEAFYGLIEMGYEVGDFELPREKRPAGLIPANLPVEAIQTEFIVNLLQTEYWNSGQLEDFLLTLSRILADKEIPFPTQLDDNKLNEIRKVYHQLILDWKALDAGEQLEMVLEV